MIALFINHYSTKSFDMKTPFCFNCFLNFYQSKSFWEASQKNWTKILAIF